MKYREKVQRVSRRIYDYLALVTEAFDEQLIVLGRISNEAKHNLRITWKANESRITENSD